MFTLNISIKPDLIGVSLVVAVFSETSSVTPSAPVLQPKGEVLKPKKVETQRTESSFVIMDGIVTMAPASVGGALCVLRDPLQ